MKILIGTPTYNHQVTAPFTHSLLLLKDRLQGRADTRWIAVQSTFINVARNYIATTVLHEPETTHLLFIDSDVSFRPEAVERMLAFDRPVVATAYPRRSLDQERVVAAAKRGKSTADAFAAGLSYPVVLTNPCERIEGFASAEAIPTGLMLIKRKVFERFRDEPGLYVDPTNSLYEPYKLSRVLLCFEPSLNPNGIPIGEDFAFCKRWRALGGELWALLDEPTTHVGTYPYHGMRG